MPDSMTRAASAEAQSPVPPEPWSSLLASVRRRRSVEARFFKPICLIAAADVIESGEALPESIRPDPVIRRFGELVEPIFPKRAHLGCEPLWHLSNDGAWTFFKGGAPVRAEDFGPARKPKSKTGLLRRVDAARVPDDALHGWRSPEGRAKLRRLVLDLLGSDADADSARILDALRPEIPRVDAEVDPGSTAPARRRGVGAPSARAAYVRYLRDRELEIGPAHHHLQQAFARYAREQLGAEDVVLDAKRVDLRFTLPGKRAVLCEVKPCEPAAARFAVRTAMGQLLDYRQGADSATALLIVIGARPSEERDLDLALSNGFGVAFSDGVGFAVHWPATAAG